MAAAMAYVYKGSYVPEVGLQRKDFDSVFAALQSLPCCKGDLQSQVSCNSVLDGHCNWRCAINFFTLAKEPLPSRSSDDMMSTNIEPAMRSSLADAITEKLKVLIKSGKYKSGDKLPSEPELMQQFGVGRSSIREAVRILVNCGLVNVKQGLGTFVILNEGLSEPLHQRLKRAGNKDLHEVRQLLELKAAEKAAENRTQKDITKMASLLKRLKASAEKGDVQACIELDVQFHIALAEASKNDILADLYKTIAVQIKKSFQQVFEDTSLMLEKQQLHEDLLQSIIDKDAKKAWNLIADITGQSVLV